MISWETRAVVVWTSMDRCAVFVASAVDVAVADAITLVSACTVASGADGPADASL